MCGGNGMKRKKIMTALLATVLSAIFLMSCGSSDLGDSTGGTSASSEEISVNLILSARDEYLSIMEREANQVAAEYGVTITAQDAANDTAKQIQFVETARNNGDKAVIVNLVDPAAAAEIVEKAGDMKVVFINRYPTDDSILNENVVYVGSDEREAGEMQAAALAEYFDAEGKTDIKYVLIQGTLGQDSVIKRTDSALTGLEENGINAKEATAPVACDWDRAKALDKVATMVSSGLEFDCIISNNDAMAIGAIEALEAAGIDPNTIPIVGVDATPDGVQAVQEGKMLMTALQDAKGQGKGVVMALVNLLEGKAINDGTDYELAADNENVVWIPFQLVNKDNADEYADYYDN